VISAGHAFIQNLRRDHYELATHIDRATGFLRPSPNSPSPSERRADPQSSLTDPSQRNCAVRLAGEARCASDLQVLVDRQATGANHGKEVPYVGPGDWQPLGRPVRRLASDVPMFVPRRGGAVSPGLRLSVTR
jgi:hypothetical protein